jgi:membrane fusion protein, multidrug efflux system
MQRIAIAAVAILACAGCAKPLAHAMPPPTVAVVTVAAESVPLSRTFIGRTTARTSVDIRARVQGTLLERPFQEGSTVSAGAVLFRIDPREYQALVSSARAALAQARARLAQAVSDLKRIEPLAAVGQASQEMLETRRTDVAAAQAQVEVGEANLTTAELNLGYTTITAPFAGKAGQAARDPGALVGPADGALTVIDQVDPIAIEFSISERDVLGYRKRVAAGDVVVADASAHGMAHLTLVDGSDYPHGGIIDFTDVRIRPETGTAMMRATFPNPAGTLVPGQFVRITLTGMEQPDAILVPQSAVLHGPLGATVYVIGQDGVAEMRQVKLGSWVGGRWLITDGLRPGDRVAVSGLMKIRPGAPVAVQSEAVQDATMPNATRN